MLNVWRVLLDYQGNLGKSGHPLVSSILTGMLSGFKIAGIILRIEDILRYSGQGNLASLCRNHFSGFF